MFIDFKAPIQAVAFGKIQQKKGRWHEGRTLIDHLLVYCTQGEIEMQIGDGRYLARIGDALFIPAGTFYVPLSKQGCAYYFFHFTATSGSPQQEELFVHDHGIDSANEYAYSYSPLDNECMELRILTPATGIARVQELLLQAEETTVCPHPTQKLLLDCLLRELLVLLSPDFTRPQNQPKRLQNVLRYIQNHLHEPLRLTELAKRFYVSESYMARLFRTELKTSLSHYVNALRVNNAKNLLVHTDLQIAEIAERLGYASTYYFSRVFKALTNLSPQAFRQQKPAD